MPDHNIYSLLHQEKLLPEKFPDLTTIDIEHINQIKHDQINGKPRAVQIFNQLNLDKILESKYFDLYLTALNSQQAIEAVNHNTLREQIAAITNEQTLNDFLTLATSGQTQSPQNNSR